MASFTRSADETAVNGSTAGGGVDAGPGVTAVDIAAIVSRQAVVRPAIEEKQ